MNPKQMELEAGLSALTDLHLYVIPIQMDPSPVRLHVEPGAPVDSWFCVSKSSVCDALEKPLELLTKMY